jgi:hypothetical protein
VRHGGGDAASKRLDKGEACGNALTVTGGEGLTLHVIRSSKGRGVSADGVEAGQPRYQPETDQKAKLRRTL